MGSRLVKGKGVGMDFLDGVRPFERARISSGLRDLLHMGIIETTYEAATDQLLVSSGEHYAAAARAQDVPRDVDIKHLKGRR